MGSETNKEYSVNWKNHMNHIRKAFDHLLVSNELTDVTLFCEGKKIRAHKILLSACSTFFHDTFKDVPCQHPVVIMHGLEYSVLSDILHFIYNGEVSVNRSNLDSFLKAAQLLQISGLAGSISERVDQNSANVSEVLPESQADEESYAEPITSSSCNEEPRRGAKRPRIKEQEARDKTARQENDATLVSAVKCEPSELATFEDALEDPLLQADQAENNEFFAGTHERGEEDFKIERGFVETALMPDTDMVKVRHSNFSEECLKCPVCSKVFSHPYSLHHHKAVHSGNTQCPICHAVLSRKYNLKMHMKARHNV